MHTHMNTHTLKEGIRRYKTPGSETKNGCYFSKGWLELRHELKLLSIGRFFFFRETSILFLELSN